MLILLAGFVASFAGTAKLALPWYVHGLSALSGLFIGLVLAEFSVRLCRLLLAREPSRRWAWFWMIAYLLLPLQFMILAAMASGAATMAVRGFLT